MEMSNTGRELLTYIHARYSIIYVVSSEERRVQSAIAGLAGSIRWKPTVKLWSLVSGATRVDGTDLDSSLNDPSAALAAVNGDRENSIWVLRDFHPFLDSNNAANVPVIRLLRELGQALKETGGTGAAKKCVILLSPQLVIPSEMESEIAVVEWPLPTGKEMEEVVSSALSSMPEERRASVIGASNLEEVAAAAQGLTTEGAMDCLARSIVLTGKLDTSVVASEKKQAVARSGLLEIIDPDPLGLDGVGGLESLKAWLMQRRRGFTKEAAAYGLPQPKGVLTVGVAGCGKSLAAKATAMAWRVPLIRMDFGRIFGSYIGQSEGQLRTALKTAEAAAPCVLFIDELEKGLSGSSSSGSTDGGTTSRVLGQFLTWMQERKAPVFVFATANDVTALPPELLRHGRWDELYFIDLPNDSEREAIWKVHLARRNRDASKFDLGMLVFDSSGMSGAEIESALVEGMFNSFSASREVTTEDIRAALATTVPLSKTASEKIDELRRWAQQRARPATAATKGRDTNGSRLASVTGD